MSTSVALVTAALHREHELLRELVGEAAASGSADVIVELTGIAAGFATLLSDRLGVAPQTVLQALATRMASNELGHPPAAGEAA